ncbi:MAG: hypothetical protein RLZZ461_1003 [Planctomycetota bacterium]|jgi:hypothetical protein
MRRPLDVVSTALLLLFVMSTGSITPHADAQESTKTAASEGSGDLGVQLKAGVMIGLIDMNDAEAIAKVITDFEGVAPDDRTGKGDPKNAESPDGREPRPVWAVFALPEGGSLRTLLEPEFLPRDAAFLNDRLTIDPGVLVIVGALLDDYRDRFERERRDVLDALAAARDHASRMSPEVQASLDAIATAAIDRTRMMDRFRAAGWATDDPAAAEKWADWASTEAAALQRRVIALQTIRDGREVPRVSPERTVSTALDRVAAFRSSRAVWRRSLEGDLAAALPSERRPELDAALDELRVEHGRRRGRFAGDAIDFHAAARAVDAPGSWPSDEPSLAEGMAELASLVDARTDARIACESAALRGHLHDLIGDERAVARAARLLEDAADVQVSAEIAVRDRTLAIAESWTEAVGATSPAVAEALRLEIRRQAFPAQMRSRWCESAIAASLDLTDLDAPSRAALEELAASLEARIELIREQAILDRLRREVRIARAMAEASVDDYASAKSMDERTWREPGAEDFDRLDVEIETALRGILTPTQFERLPPRAPVRSGAMPKRDTGKESKAGTAASSGKGTNK